MMYYIVLAENKIIKQKNVPLLLEGVVGDDALLCWQKQN